jgi:hypothetical protein
MDGPAFEMRIVNIDYYMAAPLPEVDVCYSSLEGTQVDQVPVVRIYGKTPGGQKACLHVHKASAFSSTLAPGWAAVSAAAFNSFLIHARRRSRTSTCRMMTTFRPSLQQVCKVHENNYFHS